MAAAQLDKWTEADDVEMRAVTKQEILGTKPPKRKFLGLLGLQGAIFSFVYANIEWVLGSPAQIIFFPMATGVSLYATYETIQTYRKEKNKSLGKKVGVAVALLSTLIEVVAVTAAVAAYTLDKWGVGFEFIPQVTAAVGLPLATFTVVPVMFVAMLGINFLAHFSKTVIHGVKMASTYYRDGGAYSKKFEHHKNQFLDNLRMSVVLGVSTAAVGLLLMTPALHLATLSIGLITAVKATASVVAGLNGLYTWRNTYNLYKMRQAQKKEKAERATAANTVLPEAAPQPPVANQPAPRVVVSNNPYAVEGRFTSLRNHTEDLIRKMEAISGNPYSQAPSAPESPKRFMLEFIDREKKVLLKAFEEPTPPAGAAPAAAPASAKNNDQEEREQEDVQQLKPKFFLDPRAQSLKDKLQVLGWLETLVLKGSVDVTYRDGSSKSQTTTAGLLEYVEKNSALKEKNIFSSFTNNKGGMQKVFALASEYVGNPKYDPNTGKKFTGPAPVSAGIALDAADMRESRMSLRSSATAAAG